MNASPASSPPASRGERALLLGGALAALLPLVMHWQYFSDLFWFGDEWDQLDQIHQHGYWRWVFSFFGENFAPVFKAIWGAVVLAGGGSYLPPLLLAWLVHAANVGLLGAWLRQAGYGWPGTLLAMGVLGLTLANLETLGWSVQLLALQSLGFFLLAALLQPALRRGAALTSAPGLLFIVCALAATFSSVRGVLVGGALAVAACWPLAEESWRPDRRRLRLAAGCVALSLALVLVVAIGTGGGNSQPAAGGLAAAAGRYAVHYFFSNPFHLLLEFDSWGPRTALLLGTLKAAVLAAGWYHATRSQRRLLATVLAFDLGTALLLGLGRHHTGLESAISSRYQYGALIGTLPFLAVLADRFVHRLTPRPAARLVAGLLLAALAGGWTARNWGYEMQHWSDWRGRAPRHLLLAPGPAPEGNAVPGIPFMPNARAKELIRHYNLH